MRFQPDQHLNILKNMSTLKTDERYNKGVKA